MATSWLGNFGHLAFPEEPCLVSTCRVTVYLIYYGDNSDVDTGSGSGTASTQSGTVFMMRESPLNELCRNGRIMGSQSGSALRVGRCQALLPEYDPGTRKDRKERLLQVVLVSTHITCLLLPRTKNIFFFK